MRPIVIIFDTIPALLRVGARSLQANDLMKELAAAKAAGLFKWHFFDEPDASGAMIELMPLRDADDATYVFDRFFPHHQKPDGTMEGHEGLRYADLDISDHGLFIAGIIHSLAPTAEIHLIEILNRNGLVSMASFAQGVHKAKDILQNRGSDAPVVFNASLMFDPPIKVLQGTIKELVDAIQQDLQYPESSAIQQALADQKITDDEAALLSEHFGTVALAKVMGQALAFAAAIPTEKGSPANHVWVAAAGNEADGAPVRPEAGYPAYAPFVIGVGALRKPQAGGPRFQFASYSNKADPTSSNGIWAFGGDYDIDFKSRDIEDRAANPRGGLLGVSLKTSSGFARWAGTSFAAAVVSGVIARVMSHGKTDVVWHDTDNGFFTKFNCEGDDWYALDLFQP